MSGKGDTRRPQQISDEEMNARWEAAFGKKDDALISDSTDKDRHYEEASDLSEEMRLHQRKMCRDDDDYLLAC